MARCHANSAQQSGVSCLEFYRLQTLVASQAKAFRGSLRKLGGTLSRRGGMDVRDKATAARFEKYMGRDAARNYNRIAFANNVLFNAERELRSTVAIAEFDKKLGAGGTTRAGAMVFGTMLSTTTILHEAIHFGTAPWRSKGGVPLILDRGTIGSYQTYGTLQASLERARYGWDYTSRSAASFAWLVTGP